MSRRRKTPAKNRPREVADLPTRHNRVEWIGLALVLLATFLAYRPALKGGQLWDDDRHIPSTAFQSSHGLFRIWFEPGATQQYYPLLHTAFWFEHKLWGDSVLGYHLATLFWHMLAVVLFNLTLKKLKIPGALLAAAIFALHPVMVESVAWIAEQKNTLSLVFYLAALLAYLNFDESRRWTHYFAALGLFICALLSKSAAVTFVPAIPIIAWWQRGTISWRRDLVPLLPFIAIGIPVGLVTSYVERRFLGAEGPNYELQIVDAFLVAGRAVWFYIGKLIWPADLIPVYPRWAIDRSEWWQWIFSIAAIVVTVGLWMARKWSRAPLAAWLFFCATLFPVLGFFKVAYFLYTFVADHFAYVASLGMIALAAAGITRLLERMPQASRTAGYAICIGMLGILAFLTARQSRYYAGPLAFYQTIVDRNPNSWLGQYNMGLAWHYAGNHQKASERFSVAAEQLDHVLQLDFKNSDAQANLGVALMELGKISEAIGHFQRAITINPHNLDARQNLGVLLAKSGRTNDAIEQFHWEMQADPTNLTPCKSITDALAVAGRNDEAIAAAERAIEVAKNNGQTADAKHLEDQLTAFRSELRSRPQNNTSGTATSPSSNLNAEQKRP